MTVDVYPQKVESKLPDSEIEEKCLLGSREDIDALRQKATELYPGAYLIDRFHEESNFFMPITLDAWNVARDKVEKLYPGLIDTTITFPKEAKITPRIRQRTSIDRTRRVIDLTFKAGKGSARTDSDSGLHDTDRLEDPIFFPNNELLTITDIHHSFLMGLGTGVETSWISKRETWQLTPTATLDLQDGVSFYGFTAEVEAKTENEVTVILGALNLQKITGAQKKEFYRMLKEREVNTDMWKRRMDINHFVGVAAKAGAMVVNRPSDLTLGST